MRAPLLTAALVAALLGVPVTPASAAPAAPMSATQIGSDEAGLAQATARAIALGAQLEQAWARDGSYRVALERLEQQRVLAQARLDRHVREVFTAPTATPLAGWAAGLAATGLRRIRTEGAAAAVAGDRELLDDVAARSLAIAALHGPASAARKRLAAQAGAALAAQEQARQLLAEQQVELAAAQAAAAASASAAELARLGAQAARLATASAALDQASAVVTQALTPAQTARGRRAQAREAPIIELVEAAGSNYPAGYRPTGELLSGLASWYGPGFVGSPTATGAPYDPERLTCAHKTLRLGTVIRVSANGRAISCLVNDRGPYVEPRIVDLSRAGSRALGFDGVAQVVVEVLTPI